LAIQAKYQKTNLKSSNNSVKMCWICDILSHSFI